MGSGVAVSIRGRIEDLESAELGGSESDMMRVVDGRWEGDCPRTLSVKMTLVVCQTLQLVICEAVLVREDCVVGRFRSPLDTFMGAQEEVPHPGSSHDLVDHSSGDRVLLFAILPIESDFLRENSCVVPLLHSDERDRRPVVVAGQAPENFYDRSHFFLEHGVELPVGHSIAVHDDSLRLPLCFAIETSYNLLDGGFQDVFLNDLLVGGVGRLPLCLHERIVESPVQIPCSNNAYSRRHLRVSLSDLCHSMVYIHACKDRISCQTLRILTAEEGLAIFRQIYELILRGMEYREMLVDSPMMRVAEVLMRF